VDSIGPILEKEVGVIFPGLRGAGFPIFAQDDFFWSSWSASVFFSDDWVRGKWMTGPLLIGAASIE
jgi:hypothetical protein